PGNIGFVREYLLNQHRLVAPSKFSETNFEDFRYNNSTRSEATVMRKIIPNIAGNPVGVLNESQVAFTNLASIMKDTAACPNPDWFDGAHPDAPDQAVKLELDSVIIPTKKAGVPVAPNSFLEAKSTGGSHEVAEGQAVLDGAYGALSMFALKNY
ncbi:hypothetical protein Micbo1qcDRAFT_111962, partial [Microdochium bolleyi]